MFLSCPQQLLKKQPLHSHFCSGLHAKTLADPPDPNNIGGFLACCCECGGSCLQIIGGTMIEAASSELIIGVIPLTVNLTEESICFCC